MRSARSCAKGESPCALGAEVSVGDVTRPRRSRPPSKVVRRLSALSAATDREAGGRVRGNVSLLSAAREAGARRFVYSSALHADHPLSQRVGTFREKARFEEVLLGADDVSATVLRPSMFMETLLLALKGPCLRDGPPAAPGVLDLRGRRGPRRRQGLREGHNRPPRDRRSRHRHLRRSVPPPRRHGGRIIVLHPPLSAVRLAGRYAAPVEELANMFALFDAAGYATDPTPLRDVFGVGAHHRGRPGGFPQGPQNLFP